jgi:hypothetical protein
MRPLKICLPTRAAAPPAGPDWIHEVKHDGYRMLAVRDGGRTRLISRHGRDWGDRFAVGGVGTELAAEAGFQHVQLHAAHGYLFSLLLDARLYDGAADRLALVGAWAQGSREAGLTTKKGSLFGRRSNGALPT